MTFEPPRAGPRPSAEATALVALLSPLLAGAAWAALAYVFWRGGSDPENPGLDAAGASLSVVLPGLFGLGALVIPVMIGLVTRSVLTRLAAAWVEAVICALAGVLWFLEVVFDDLPHPGGLLGAGGALALLVPLAVAGASTRYLMGWTDAGRR